MVSSSDQAKIIDQLLRDHLLEREYAARRIICGSPAEFQGDERHVVFLSMVDTADGGSLQMRQHDSFRQRFNVAASRAQNQLWVVHSLNPATDLKHGDLRLRLIEHAQDPSALANQLEALSGRAESEFERQVIRRLNERDYRLVSQWPVGAFRIDIVVLGEGNNKVAIECDGDRYHPPEQQESDHRRQLMLERMGWRFIRIRSSHFFRDPDAVIERVCRRLDDLDIRPIGALLDGAQQRSESNELRERVVRRATELRREWCEASEEDGGRNQIANGHPDAHPSTSMFNNSAVPGTAPSVSSQGNLFSKDEAAASRSDATEQEMHERGRYEAAMEQAGLPCRPFDQWLTNYRRRSKAK